MHKKRINSQEKTKIRQRNSFNVMHFITEASLFASDFIPKQLVRLICFLQNVSCIIHESRNMAIHSISSLKEIFFDTLETGKYKTGCIVTRKTSVFQPDGSNFEFIHDIIINSFYDFTTKILNLHFDDWIQQIYFYLSFRFESTKAV